MGAVVMRQLPFLQHGEERVYERKKQSGVAFL